MKEKKEEVIVFSESDRYPADLNASIKQYNSYASTIKELSRYGGTSKRVSFYRIMQSIYIKEIYKKANAIEQFVDSESQKFNDQIDYLREYFPGENLVYIYKSLEIKEQDLQENNSELSRRGERLAKFVEGYFNIFKSVDELIKENSLPKPNSKQ